jgi:hypothetical protein
VRALKKQILVSSMRQQPAKPVVFTPIANGVFSRRRRVGLAKRPHAGIPRQRPLFTRDSCTQFVKRVRGRKTQAGDDDLLGGWGIQLVRQNMDEVRYTRAGGENILRLTRRLASSAGGK